MKINCPDSWACKKDAYELTNEDIGGDVRRERGGERFGEGGKYGLLQFCGGCGDVEPDIVNFYVVNLILHLQ